MDSYKPTSKNLYSSSVCRLDMPSRGPTKQIRALDDDDDDDV